MQGVRQGYRGIFVPVQITSDLILSGAGITLALAFWVGLWGVLLQP